MLVRPVYFNEQFVIRMQSIVCMMSKHITSSSFPILSSSYLLVLFHSKLLHNSAKASLFLLVSAIKLTSCIFFPTFYRISTTFTPRTLSSSTPYTVLVEHFRVYIASSKHKGVWRIQDSYANPQLHYRFA